MLAIVLAIFFFRAPSSGDRKLWWADSPQSVFLGQESQLDGRLIKPCTLALRATRQRQLALVQKSLFHQDVAGFHYGVSFTA